MSDPLGLSIGTTNLVAVRAGRSPVTHRAVLTLFPHATPRIGTPAEYPAAQPGLVVDGFVERMGQREPLVATDGSTHRPELLLADAIEAMVATVGAAGAQVAIAVPAYWPTATWQVLQQALQSRPAFGVAPSLVCDAVAALTALDSDRGVASRGVVALLDFGGGGTGITLADAGSGFAPIDETLRYQRFSGNEIDQAILAYILGSGEHGDTAPVATTAVEGLAHLTDECRRAKERLSAQAATEVVVELPGYRSRTTLTRAELENLIRDPLDGVVAELENMLRRNRIDWDDLAAVGAVGGGANIPLVIERLSARHRVPVVTTDQPAVAVAVGAVLCVAGGARDTRSAPISPTAAGTAAQEAAGEATAMAAAMTTTAGLRSNRGAGAGADSAMVNGLAWSEEDGGTGNEPVPFTGEPYDDGPAPGRPATAPPPRRPVERKSRSRVPRLTLALGLGGLVAAIAIAGAVYTLTSASHDTRPAPADSSTAVPPPAPVSAPSPPPAPPGPAPNTENVAPPPPPPATDQATATTTAPQPTTTTTTVPPTTTTTTTTTVPPTTTTTAPPTTTAAPTTTAPPTTAPPTTTVPMTTEYLRIPFVPVPIPIQVPAN